MQLYDKVFGQYDRVCVLFLCFGDSLGPSRPVVARDGACTRFEILIVVARAPEDEHAMRMCGNSQGCIALLDANVYYDRVLGSIRAKTHITIGGVPL